MLCPSPQGWVHGGSRWLCRDLSLNHHDLARFLLYRANVNNTVNSMTVSIMYPCQENPHTMETSLLLSLVDTTLKVGTGALIAVATGWFVLRQKTASQGPR